VKFSQLYIVTAIIRGIHLNDVFYIIVLIPSYIEDILPARLRLISNTVYSNSSDFIVE